MKQKIRCTYSKEWRSAFSRSQYSKQERYGYIVGWSRDGKCFVVLWDNSKTKQYYHISFIDVIQEQKPEPVMEEKVSIVEEQVFVEPEADIPPTEKPYSFYIHPEDKIK